MLNLDIDFNLKQNLFKSVSKCRQNILFEFVIKNSSLGIMMLPQIYWCRFQSNGVKCNPHVVILSTSVQHAHKTLQACKRCGLGGDKLITLAGKTTDLIMRN
jgi:hypothetical protein